MLITTVTISYTFDFQSFFLYDFIIPLRSSLSLFSYSIASLYASLFRSCYYVFFIKLFFYTSRMAIFPSWLVTVFFRLSIFFWSFSWVNLIIVLEFSTMILFRQSFYSLHLDSFFSSRLSMFCLSSFISCVKFVIVKSFSTNAASIFFPILTFISCKFFSFRVNTSFSLSISPLALYAFSEFTKSFAFACYSYSKLFRIMTAIYFPVNSMVYFLSNCYLMPLIHSVIIWLKDCLISPECSRLVSP